jgi:hypothetical protein
MCRRNVGRRRGVSAIAGGAIVLAIFFMVIVPLVVLMQNSYALFLNESNSRRIFDTDRMSESLTVGVSQDAITKRLTLLLSNDGPVNVRIVRVWAIDVVRQTSIPMAKPCLEGELLSLPPGGNGTLDVQTCVNGFTGIVQFLAVTERGRIFSSNKIYLKEGGLIDIVFPYTLTVSIINMKKGRMYEVYVTPLGNGKVSPEKFTHKATASNENVTVAFGIFPGNYSVALYENGKLVQIPEGNPQLIEVPDKQAVIFILNRGPIISLPLDAIIIAPKKVSGNSLFIVEVDVQLSDKANESVMITSVSNILITSDLPPGQFDSDCSYYGGFSIRPGEREIVALCSIWVGEKGTGTKSVGISVPAGTIYGIGEESGISYTNEPESTTIKVT